MPKRRCLDWPAPGCLKYTTSGSRCDPCTRRRRQVRTDDRPIAAAIVASHPACECRDMSHGHGRPCGETANLEADHLVPLSAGGTNRGPRLVMCQWCNRKKGPTT